MSDLMQLSNALAADLLEMAQENQLTPQELMQVITMSRRWVETVTSMPTQVATDAIQTGNATFTAYSDLRAN